LPLRRSVTGWPGWRRSVTGTTGPEMWAGKAAFKNELGLQAPTGIWDPMGFTADSDVAAFKHRRGIELKQGRVAMLATMGHLTPEITDKLPGYLSPSTGLKSQDVPSGFAAISKVPSDDWPQIFLYGGFCELSKGTPETPGDYGWKVLISADPAERTKKLQSELANSRVAMVAVMGMSFQNGVTGTTGPEMWAGEAAFENEMDAGTADFDPANFATCMFPVKWVGGGQPWPSLLPPPEAEADEAEGTQAATASEFDSDSAAEARQAAAR
jgi:light-harvesting complex I chlorophyll a/b binding protein 1